MLFSSITFLYYFIPAVMLIYFIVPKKMKNTALLLSSLFFYGWGEPRYLIIMVSAIMAGYFFGRLIEYFRRSNKHKTARISLAASLLFSFGMLVIFKYTDFFIANLNFTAHLSLPILNIALPIGISFYTFQTASYCIDVYRGDTEAQKNFITYGTYISMFPQLVAGPIVRYSEISHQLENRSLNLDSISAGIRRFIIGLSKKVLIANTLAELTEAFKASEDKSVLFVWIYAFAYAFYVYFDFSGYSDMAIGLGKILGFDFPENFDYPYISRSITEFWRRWHMTLGRWFRSYLYIPLGGNRVSKFRLAVNIFIVWFATGFWHGAAWNFIIWGLFFAVLLIIEKLFLLKIFQKVSWIGHVYTCFFVLVSFVIFDNTSIKEGIGLLGNMFGFGNLPLVTSESLYYLKSYGVILALAAIGSAPIVKKIIKAIENHRAGEVFLSIAEPLVLTLLLLTVTAFLVDKSFNPFLYFRF